MFWEKRLQGLRPSTVYEEDFDYLRLPRTIRPIPGPEGVSEDVAIRSLASALQLNPTGITGQTSSKSDIEKNAGVFVNPDQPLVTMALLSDEDIARQEARVKVARRHLEEELASLASA
jgi:methyl-CpG-binding domain protein 2